MSLTTRNIRIFNPITKRQAANIKVAGLDKPWRIEGKYLNGFVGSECSDIKPGTFTKTIWPMLTDYHGWYILEGVPKRDGIGSAEHRELCEKVSKGEWTDCTRRTWPASDIVDPEELAEAREKLSPEDFQEQFGAQWLNAGGSVWHSFDREFNVRPVEYHPNLPLIVGQDYNRTPMSWTMNHRVGDRLKTFDEIVMNNTDTAHAMNELWRRWGHHAAGWQFYGDASGKRQTTNSSISDYAIVANDNRFKKAGRTMHYPPSNPSRKDRFAAGNARLKTADGLRHAFIDPKCTHLIRDMEMRAYISGTMELPENEGLLGHISDSWSYIAYRIWPLRFNVGASSNQVYTSDEPDVSWPLDKDRLTGAFG